MHLHSIYDGDTHFAIDPTTRKIANRSEKSILGQYDHNSERFSFELPRFVESHDMSLCNRVEVHYLNVGVDKKQEAGVYEVDDLQISPDSEGIVICSWLVSANATQLAGSLNFLLRFACVAEDGTIDYAWHTEIFGGISVANGMSNGEAVVAEFPDVLEAWKAEALAELNANLKDTDEAVENARQSALAAESSAQRAEQAANDAENSAPTAKVEKTANGATLIVTDKNGTTQATFMSVDGDSAYDIWLKAGNTGTEADFLKSLEGAPLTFAWDGTILIVYSQDGHTDYADLKGAAGKDGTNGISVTNAKIDSNYHLIITLSNGQTIDAGYCRGENGTGAGDMLAADYDSTKAVKNSGGIVAYLNNALASLTKGDMLAADYDSGNAVKNGGGIAAYVNNALANKQYAASSITGGTLGGNTSAPATSVETALLRNISFTDTEPTDVTGIALGEIVAVYE